jgi:hypothetical protein
MMRLYYTTTDGRLGLFSNKEQAQFDRYAQSKDGGFVLGLFLNERHVKDVLWLTKHGEVHKIVEGTVKHK